MTTTEVTTIADRPENSMVNYADLCMYRFLSETTNFHENHEKYLELLLADLDSKEFVDSFSDEFRRINNQLKGLFPELTIRGGDTKKLILAHISQLQAHLNLLRERVENTELTPTTSSYEGFKQLLLKTLGQDTKAFPETTLEPILRMFYEPVRLILENSAASQKEKDEIISSIMNQLAAFQTSSTPENSNNHEQTEIPIFKPRIIEVPAQISETREELQMTEVPEPKPTRTNRSSKAKDPALGE